MSNVNKSNKNSATEDEIGLLHSMVTKIFKAKLGKWLELIEGGADPDLIVDMSQLNNVIKFVGANGIICQDPAAEGSNSELLKQIQDIKSNQEKRLNVVSFQDEDSYKLG